jgi:protein-S-isoprenylcysteine O-methyltransferase Ste14
VKKLELKLPPVAVFLLVAVSMWLLARWTPGHDFHPVFRLAVIAVSMLAGAVFGVGALAGFRRSRTTVNPLEPHRANTLVTGGVYRFSRNPMYLALLWVLLAIGFALSNLYALALALCFVPYMNRFQIEPEERAMEALFGADYRRYRARVRRWL